jgi:hypothetical protein
MSQSGPVDRCSSTDKRMTALFYAQGGALLWLQSCKRESVMAWAIAL